MNTNNEDLCGLVHKHKVSYEIYPEYTLINNAKVQTGFNIEFHGIREQNAMRSTPGDKSSHLTYSDLHQVARFAMPARPDGDDYIIEPFDCALHESPRRHLQPEVVCVLCITHRTTAGQDTCDKTCLAGIETKLRSLGIPRAH